MQLAHTNMTTSKSSVWQPKAAMPMDRYEFTQWAELLQKRAGIFLPEKRKSFLLTNLNKRMRVLDFTDYRQYFSYVLAGRRGAVEWEILIDHLTVHETRFFRNMESLQMLKERFVPEKVMSTDTPQINVWSVGCATGEEPYSLAMLLDLEFKQKRSDYYLSITATDISHASLSSGRKGLYHVNRLTEMPDKYRRIYCRAVDKYHVEVIPELKQRVCFSRLNLLNLEQVRLGKMDIIYCQNVLIYFQKKERLDFLELLVRHLKPGGVLILGAGEIMDWKHPEMSLMHYPGILAYQRLNEGNLE